MEHLGVRKTILGAAAQAYPTNHNTEATNHNSTTSWIPLLGTFQTMVFFGKPLGVPLKPSGFCCVGCWILHMIHWRSLYAYSSNLNEPLNQVVSTCFFLNLALPLVGAKMQFDEYVFF